MSETLNGLTVLVTRPREQAEKLAAKITEASGYPIVFPTLEIIPVEPVEGSRQLQNKLNTTEIAVFTSANAVREMISHQLKIPEQCEIAAIGTSTQQALLDAGFLSDWVPMTEFRSEGLLKLPVFQKIKDKKIIILSGEGGREYLQDVLRDRGAKVEKIAIYKRQCPRGDVSQLEKFFERNGSKIIVSTSVESLNNLLHLSIKVGSPHEIPLIVVSERMEEAAKTIGFKRVVIAENATNVAILQAINNLCQSLET